jgi:hypothetical protein
VAYTRRRFLETAAAAGAGAAGIYELVERLGTPPARADVVEPAPAEQHLLTGERIVRDDGVPVIVPPLHHELMTARVRVSGRARELRAARTELERVLRSLDQSFAPSPAGLGVTVAWGLPYFRRLVPGLAEAHLPVDVEASRRARKPVSVLRDSIRFPSDPHDAVLDDADVAILLRSDSAAHVAEAARRIFHGPAGGLLEVRSVRRGFVGGGFDGEMGLPKKMALAAGVPGAHKIPDAAELFLGFTSTQRSTQGPGRIANFETLGLVDRVGYFRHGTQMHLSHLFEDLEEWYGRYDHAQRVQLTFRPGVRARPGARTVPQVLHSPYHADVTARQYRHTGVIGHSGAIQSASRLPRSVRGPDGTVYPRGTAVPQRADFNTLDNPFAWTADSKRDGFRKGAAAGIHFVSFQPTTTFFERVRLAMDGRFADGEHLYFERRDPGQGINRVLRTTHRQNFVVPPRAHRSFPLVELLR